MPDTDTQTERARLVAARDNAIVAYRLADDAWHKARVARDKTDDAWHKADNAWKKADNNLREYDKQA